MERAFNDSTVKIISELPYGIHSHTLQYGGEAVKVYIDIYEAQHGAYAFVKIAGVYNLQDKIIDRLLFLADTNMDWQYIVTYN